MDKLAVLHFNNDQPKLPRLLMALLALTPALKQEIRELLLDDELFERQACHLGQFLALIGPEHHVSPRLAYNLVTTICNLSIQGAGQVQLNDDELQFVRLFGPRRLDNRDFLDALFRFICHDLVILISEELLHFSLICFLNAGLSALQVVLLEQSHVETR